MSLYSFIDNYVKDCPELLLSSNVNSNTNNFSFTNVYNNFYKSQERSNIQAFTDLLFYDSINRCSNNVVEYELLKQKTKKIAQLSQTMFDLSFNKMIKNTNKV